MGGSFELFYVSLAMRRLTCNLLRYGPVRRYEFSSVLHPESMYSSSAEEPLRYVPKGVREKFIAQTGSVFRMAVVHLAYPSVMLNLSMQH